jgi:hypothetical protein
VQVDDVLCERKADPETAPQLRGVLGSLTERFEQRRLACGRNAETRILDVNFRAIVVAYGSQSNDAPI